MVVADRIHVAPLRSLNRLLQYHMAETYEMYGTADNIGDSGAVSNGVLQNLKHSRCASNAADQIARLTIRSALTNSAGRTHARNTWSL